MNLNPNQLNIEGLNWKKKTKKKTQIDPSLLVKPGLGEQDNFIETNWKEL
jgi:hypothetical protein